MFNQSGKNLYYAIQQYTTIVENKKSGVRELNLLDYFKEKFGCALRKYIFVVYAIFDLLLGELSIK